MEMALNLKEKCYESKKKEFFYGAKINKDIKDVYLGLGYLEPGESGRKNSSIHRIEQGKFSALSLASAL